MEPYLLPLAGVVVAFALVAFGMFARGAVTKTLVVRVVPPELNRLAAAFQITEDIPETQSYGALAHDLFEEKNSEIFFLQQDLEDERINADSWQRRAEVNEPPTKTVLPGWRETDGAAWLGFWNKKVEQSISNQESA